VHLPNLGILPYFKSVRIIYLECFFMEVPIDRRVIVHIDGSAVGEYYKSICVLAFCCPERWNQIKQFSFSTTNTLFGDFAGKSHTHTHTHTHSLSLSLTFSLTHTHSLSHTHRFVMLTRRFTFLLWRIVIEVVTWTPARKANNSQLNRQ